MSGGMEHCAELEKNNRMKLSETSAETTFETIGRLRHETERMIYFCSEMINHFKIQRDALNEHLETINCLIEKFNK